MEHQFSEHPGYNRVFRQDKLTLGIFLPFEQYQASTASIDADVKYIKQIDDQGFAALWVRDIPMYDPSFGDIGQAYDPLSYLAFIAAHTSRIALGTASVVLPLHHPISLAKTTATLDQISKGRLLFGVGSGDRLAEYAAFDKSYDNRSRLFREGLADLRTLQRQSFPQINSSLTRIRDLDLIPKPTASAIPTLITGASQQDLKWIAAESDGWITYPGPTTTDRDTLSLQAKISAFRALIPDGRFKPHMTNEWIELDRDPHFPRTPLRGGFVLKTGRYGLIELLSKWQEIGVNHAALGIQFASRPVGETLDELAREVLPLFPSLTD